MKYVISDRDEVAVGTGFHSEIAHEADFNGKVIRAGHCKENPDGSYEVWGESLGYGIQARSEDAEILTNARREADIKKEQ